MTVKKQFVDGFGWVEVKVYPYKGKTSANLFKAKQQYPAALGKKQKTE